MTKRAHLPGASELFRTTGSPGEVLPAAAAPAAEPNRATSGRRRHEEKITVYCSAEELLALERVRLDLRAEHGLAADRGRIVREALAVVIEDLSAHGDDSMLVRRLRET
jgi:hypothetical protein